MHEKLFYANFQDHVNGNYRYAAGDRTIYWNLNLIDFLTLYILKRCAIVDHCVCVSDSFME